MTHLTPESAKKLLEHLKDSTASTEGEDLDAASWECQEGFLLTLREAIFLRNLLTSNEESKLKETIFNYNDIKKPPSKELLAETIGEILENGGDERGIASAVIDLFWDEKEQKQEESIEELQKRKDVMFKEYLALTEESKEKWWSKNENILKELNNKINEFIKGLNLSTSPLEDITTEKNLMKKHLFCRCMDEDDFEECHAKGGFNSAYAALKEYARLSSFKTK